MWLEGAGKPRVAVLPLPRAGEDRGEGMSAANAFDVDVQGQVQLAALTPSPDVVPMHARRDGGLSRHRERRKG